MDENTQQNSALVEEMAAASALNDQAHELVQAVAVFRVKHDQGCATPRVQRTPPRLLGALNALARPSSSPYRELRYICQ